MSLHSDWTLSAAEFAGSPPRHLPEPVTGDNQNLVRLFIYYSSRLQSAGHFRPVDLVTLLPRKDLDHISFLDIFE